MEYILNQISCFFCQHENFFDPPLSLREACSKCQRDLHICLNCALYDRNTYHECREDQAEWVRDKEKANHCSYFMAQTHKNDDLGKSKTAQQKLDELFGGKQEEKPSLSLEDLFKK